MLEGTGDAVSAGLFIGEPFGGTPALSVFVFIQGKESAEDPRTVEKAVQKKGRQTP
jgi:hypothetical protein